MKTCEGGTASEARNAAIALATGEWIFSLDADDTVDPTFLRKAAGYAWQYERPIISCDSVFFGQSHLTSLERAAKARSSSGIYRYPPREAILNMNPICSCALFARKLWEEAGGFNVAMLHFEDWELWIRCIKKHGGQVTQIHENLHRYRIHEDSVMEKVAFDPGIEDVFIGMMHILNSDLYPGTQKQDRETVDQMPVALVERLCAMGEKYPENSSIRELLRQT